MLFLIWLSLTFKWTSEVICLVLIHKRRWQLGRRRTGGSKFIRKGSLLSRYRTIWGGGSKIAKNSRRHLWKDPYLIFVRILSSKIIFIAKDDFFKMKLNQNGPSHWKPKSTTNLTWIDFQSKIYHTHTIITCGLYIFHPIFESQKRFLRRVFHEILDLCMASIQEQVIMARVQYFLSNIAFITPRRMSR